MVAGGAENDSDSALGELLGDMEGKGGFARSSGGAVTDTEGGDGGLIGFF